MRSGLAASAGVLAVLIAGSATAEPQRVALEAGDGKGPFTGYLYLPETREKAPAVVAMHGCGGLLNRNGEIAEREADWARRLTAAGYAVLLTDSFNARGFREICTVKKRPIRARERAADARAAAEWLGQHPRIDASRLALMGWSHGAMTLLWAVSTATPAPQADYRTAIAFYPGCREILRESGWKPRMPLTLLLGGADDWTQPGPCRELGARAGLTVHEYPGAFHGFDAPDSRVRVRTGLATTKSGTAHVGTNPEARAKAIEVVMSTLKAALGR